MIFDQIENVKIVSSEISDGEMNFLSEDGPANIERFLVQNNINKTLVTCSQPHQTRIAIAKNPGRIEGADGILTTEDFALGIKTADCVPLMLYEQSTGLLGAIHVSRKNLLGGIISKSLDLNLKKLKVDSSKLNAFLGPHICKEHYPLKDEAISEVKNTGFTQFLTQFDEKNHFDITGAVLSELEKIGLSKENVFDSGIDTYSSPEFFSYRRDGDDIPKVFLSVITK